MDKITIQKLTTLQQKQKLIENYVNYSPEFKDESECGVYLQFLKWYNLEVEIRDLIGAKQGNEWEKL